MIDKARTPKRKRRRLDLTTPRGGKQKSLTSQASGSRRTEWKIVWKESPTEKQMKVSGTGKMAVRKELQGFVGRMTRASQQSSPTSSNESAPVDQAHVPQAKVAARPHDHGPKVATMRATEDVQDELFNVLSLMEQKYASPDLKRPESSAQASLSLTSSSSTRTLSPRSLQIEEKHSQPLEQRMPPTPSRVSNAHETSKQETPFELEDDFFDNLPEETWALLDQTQSSDTSDEAMPSLTPRPMPSTVSNEVQTSRSQTRCASAHVTPTKRFEDYQRFVVLDIDRDVVNRSLLLRLLDDHEQQMEALLRQDWYELRVEVGDHLNLIFTEQTSRACFSQDGDSHRATTTQSIRRVQVDNTQHLVVLHPDILVSPTRVTTSFSCLRRAILQETCAVTHPTAQSAFIGTLKHDLFEKALVNGLDTIKMLQAEAKHIVQSNIVGLVECGVNEETALQELKNVIQDFFKWIRDAVRGSGTYLNDLRSNTRAKVRVTSVLATEEMMWSIKWGLKGATDASIKSEILDSQGEQASGAHILPLELKTGSNKYGQEQHQGQVILYTLLLNERYPQEGKDGLLLYVSPIETNRISATAAHVRGLLVARNHFATALAQVKEGMRSSSPWSPVFPPMLRNRRDCERCFQLNECLFLHRALDNGTEASSALDELFTSKTKHVDDVDVAYFKHWNRLIDLEQQHAERNGRALWLQRGLEREAAHEGSTCIAHLKLVSDTPAASHGGAQRTLRFVRDRRKRTGARLDQPLTFVDVQFRVEDRVILSAESLDGKQLLLHVCRATVRKIEHGLMTIEAWQRIPQLVLSGESVVGKEFTWRLDQDVIASGLNRARENLVRLFSGEPPETIRAGTAVTKRPEVQRQVATILMDDGVSGDVRRRRLIVHRCRPQFLASHVVQRITERSREDASDGNVARIGQALLEAFFQLNRDQQSALERVINAVDYALILGMPGTGKTSTLALTVRVLVFLGFSVLITSYTHSAVDNLMLKLVEYKLPMLRIGHPSQIIHPIVANFTLERVAEREKLASVESLEKMMQTVALVGCTCLSVNSHVLFRTRRFDFCIVDEASQITQPIVLGALRCADTFVLVGDQYQLPPLVTNVRARTDGMDVSLFRRLVEASPDATQHLSYQYRMNRDIMTLANRLVYSGQLKCGSKQVASNYLQLDWKRDECTHKRNTWASDVLRSRQGVVFLDTDAMGETVLERSCTAGNGRKRMENFVEAQVVAAVVELFVLLSVSASEIAILAPFRSQVTLIQEQLRARATLGRLGTVSWVHAIEVSTIDKYQGKDKDVIFISFVRSNHEKRVGELLTDWRRLNVALTRAKQKLVLVGSSSTLRRGSALFYELFKVLEEEKWNVKVPVDAIETLDQMAQSVASLREPDPENSHSQTVTKATVSILKRRAARSGEIEALVPSVETVPLRSYHTKSCEIKPISQNILGEVERRNLSGSVDI
ncbi:hypothetical protein PsorP6_005929 [Peronosclerospora sorghi]|uniref:Uncharacterized protein n=1 Tax=Peronosclerospora sorghi TaxID=230839 RepID=A0ACC0W140_9STRA|nr:hypothetical protein PsorP6_005929 [Peronosclerospora sorghi]